MCPLTCKTLTVLSAFAFVAGCAEPPPPVSLDTRGVEPAVDYSALGQVLEAAVGEDNRLSPRALEDSSETLLRQVKLLAVAGPTATPELFDSADAELAYWYNARAAWAMKLALDCGCPQRLTRDELTDRPFPLDGRTMTLTEIDGLLEGYEDFRVLVASPGVCIQRAALPLKPFSAEDIHERIADRFERFIDDHDRFRIDVADKTIYFPPVLWGMRDRIIGQYESTYGTQGARLSTALLPYVSSAAARRLRNAIGYDCVSAESRWEPALLIED